MRVLPREEMKGWGRAVGVGRSRLLLRLFTTAVPSAATPTFNSHAEPRRRATPNPQVLFPISGKK